MLMPILPLGATVIATVLFAWHPLQTEAVAYVSSRSDVLMGSGILIALCGVTYRRFWLVLAGSLIAALTKEAGVMALPLALLWWQMRQHDQRPSVGWTPARVCLLSAGLLALLYWIMRETRQLGWPVAHPQEVATHISMAMALGWHFICPFGLTIDHGWFWVTPLMSMAMVIVAMTVGWLMWSTTWSRFAYIWFGLALVPRLLAHSTEPIHERHLYAAIIGSCIALGVTTNRWRLA